MQKLLKKLSVVMIIALVVTGCGVDDTGNSHIKGKIRIDGSATVAPVTQAVVEEYSKEYRQVEITVGISGTGGGFKKFVNNETAIQNASREIKDKEIEEAKANGVEYYELEIGKDAIVFAINNENTWIKSISPEQLFEIWKEDSKIVTWQDLDPTYPNEKIKLYAPSSDSGTYDYFHSEVMGKETAMRADYTASQDMNILVTGVSGDKYALGFFGYVYYQEAQDALTALEINHVAPSKETVSDGTYVPLSRGLFIYVNKEKYNKEETVASLVDFYLEHAITLTEEMGYPPLTEEQYSAEMEKLKDKTVTEK